MPYTTPEDHAQAVAQRTAQAIITKYMRGQKEHGGKLWTTPCLHKATEEAIDLIVYLDVITEQINTAVQFIQDAMNREHISKEEALTTIRNILTSGNADGIQEE